MKILPSADKEKTIKFGNSSASVPGSGNV